MKFQHVLATLLFLCLPDVNALPVVVGKSYSYQWTAPTGDVISGTFIGTASGNIVYDLSGINASINGREFGTEPLYGSSLASDGWKAGGAYASFNGTENNFMFSSYNFPHEWVNNSSFVASFPWPGPGGTLYQHYVESPHLQYSGYLWGQWKLSEVKDVPEPGTISVLIAGLMGIAAVLRFRAPNKTSHPTS